MDRRKPMILTSLVLAVATSSAMGQEEPELTDLLRAVRVAAPPDREAAVAAALAQRPLVDEVVAILRSGIHPENAPKAGWSVRQAVDSAGVARPYHLYVPAVLGKEPTPAPLLVHMHGGISRQDYVDDRTFAQWRNLWVAQADRLGIVLALPLGRSDCMWWSDAGVRHLRATVRDTKRVVPIDDDRICATGFSDGGSGAYYLALAAPDPFAAVLPLNGHPGVATAASRRQLYPQNTVLTPMLVAHTADDSLYPVTTVMPHWQVFLEQGASMHVVMYPTGDHRPAYFGQRGQPMAQGGVLADFVNQARRDDAPAAVTWHTAHVATGAARWIAITAIGATPDDAPAAPDVNVMSRPGRVRLGVNVNEAMDGGGVEVMRVVTGSNASRLGLKVRDRIHGIDDTIIDDRNDLVAALSRKRHGEPLRLSVWRKGEDDLIQLRGTIAPFTPRPAYPRTLAGASIQARADGDTLTVSSRNVRRFRVEVRPDLLELDEPITVKVNGKVRWQGRVKVDLGSLLRGYAMRADGARLTVAVLEIDCTATVGTTGAATPPGEPRKPGEDF